MAQRGDPICPWLSAGGLGLDPRSPWRKRGPGGSGAGAECVSYTRLKSGRQNDCQSNASPCVRVHVRVHTRMYPWDQGGKLRCSATLAPCPHPPHTNMSHTHPNFFSF